MLVPLDTNVPDYPHATLALDGKPLKVSSPAQVFTTRKAVIYNREGREHVEYMTAISEQSYKARNTYFDDDATFTGAMTFSDDDGKLLRGYYYEKGKRLGEIENTKNKETKDGRKAACYLTQSYTVFTYTVQSGNAINGPYYNFTDNGPFTVICDTWSPIAANMYTYNSGGGDGNGSSGWVSNPYMVQQIVNQLYVVYRPDNVIRDVDKYLECFTDDANSSYRLTVSVDQPVAGSNAYMDFQAQWGDKFVVGHAYLTLTQTRGDGSVISRTIGFYPDGMVLPFSPSSGPAYNDDSFYPRGWDVQATFTLNGPEMMQVTSFVGQYGNQNYNLINRNCGNMCTGALGILGIGVNSDWMNSPWYTYQSGSSGGNWYNPNTPFQTRYGPSIGKLGERLFEVQSPRLVNKTHSGGSPPQGAGTCN